MTGLSLIPLPVPLPASPPLSNWGFRDNRISGVRRNGGRINVYYKEGRGRNPCCSDENPNLCLALTLFIHVSFLSTRPTERGQCGYDIEKASDVLLDLAAPTIEKSNNDRHPNYIVDNIGDERFLVDPNDSLIDRRSESTSLSSNGDLSDNLWSVGSFDRKYVEVVSSSKADYAGSPEFIKSDIPQKVLESLFNIPKSTEHDKDTMNWRNVVKQIQTLGPGFNPSQRVAESKQRTYDTQQLLQQQANMQADNEDDQQPSSAAGHYGNDY
ncbi:hypothetical protein Fmac_005820 [Flemingia macrophylla]|uniref:Uncharacterized protein n=1 Tax=Flemingia macrophylla TaxID=520843 RepID=A0ABD1N8U6_9FABA